MYYALRLSTLCLLALSACGDTGFPTDSERSGTPRIQPGDQIQVLVQSSPQDEGPCVDRSVGEPSLTERFHVCVPVAPNRYGVEHVQVDIQQDIYDPQLGMVRRQNIAPTVDADFTESPILEGAILTPSFEPEEQQRAGPLHVQVAITTDSGTRTFTHESAFRARPVIHYVEVQGEPVAGSEMVIDVGFSEADVNQVVLRAEGAVERKMARSFDPATDDGVARFHLPIPFPVPEDYLDLQATAISEQGVESTPYELTVPVAEDPQDDDVPLLSLPTDHSGVLWSGKELPVTVDGGGDIHRVELIITPRDAGDIIVSAAPSGGEALMVLPDLSLQVQGEAEIRIRAFDKSGRIYYLRSGEVATTDERLAARIDAILAPTRLVGPDAPLEYSDLFIDPTEESAYWVDPGRNRVDVYHLGSGTQLASIPVGSRPGRIVPVPDATGAPSNRLLVTNEGGSEISVVNRDTRSEVARFPVPGIVLRPLDAEQNPGTSLVTSNRPADLAVQCATTGCGSHWVYIATDPSPTTSDARGIVKKVRLNAMNEVVEINIMAPYAGDDMALPGEIAHSEDYLVLHANRETGALDSLAVVSNRLASATRYEDRRPVISTSHLSGSPLHLGLTGVESPNPARILRLRPDADYSGTASSLVAVLGGHEDEPLAMHRNTDGGRILVPTEEGLFLLDLSLSLRGTFNLSAAEIEYTASARLQGGHTTTGLSFAQGGALSIPSPGTGVAIFDTNHFSRVIDVRTPSQVTGPPALLQGTDGRWGLLIPTDIGVFHHTFAPDDVE